MEIIIHDDRVIEDIQREFSEKYPNLKIEFFIKIEPKGNNPAKKLIMHSGNKLCDCREEHSKGSIPITPDMTIRDVERALRHQFGLHPRIYHKIGSDWLEPSTRHWSLEKQNSTSLESNSESTLERV
ncbi:MAG: hypothetical protein HKL88_02280 [Bacteroidia bacterium]|jgi:hypothetical protein|nr:hypothetical protein [Bacteroidia bacterium]